MKTKIIAGVLSLTICSTFSASVFANAAEPISSVSQAVTTTENETEVSVSVIPMGKIVNTIKLGENVTGELYENGVVDIADAALIKGYLLNSKKYEISAQGLINADVQEKGNGIIDVITIQQYMLKIIDSFDNV